MARVFCKGLDVIDNSSWPDSETLFRRFLRPIDLSQTIAESNQEKENLERTSTSA
jgi:hypothetical protein